MKSSVATFAFAAAVTAFAAPALAADPVALNTPNAGAWNVYGAGQTVANFKDSNVEGGGGKRVTIANATTNPWDIGANVDVEKPYKKGDALMFAVYLKLESRDPNATVDIPATIQINKAPYTAVIQGTVTVTTQWQLLYINGVADKDYDGKGATAATLNLGGQAKVIDLGPAFVLDSGQQ